jgi:hypothetical protein
MIALILGIKNHFSQFLGAFDNAQVPASPQSQLPFTTEPCDFAIFDVNHVALMHHTDLVVPETHFH